MESRTAFKDSTYSDIRLPKEVYYRCIWTVRDSRRLSMIAGSLNDPGDKSDTDVNESQTGSELSTTVSENTSGYRDTMLISDETVQQAGIDLNRINNALTKVPEVYREGLLDNIIDRKEFADFAHINTWKRWKLVFLYELAREFHYV